MRKLHKWLNSYIPLLLAILKNFESATRGSSNNTGDTKGLISLNSFVLLFITSPFNPEKKNFNILKIKFTIVQVNFIIKGKAIIFINTYSYKKYCQKK